MGSANASTRGYALIVFALAWLAFLPALANGFVRFDDATYVTDNPIVRGGLTWDAVTWAFTTTYFANWHPLTWLSHCLDVTLFGLDPRGHHATSVLLHAVASAFLVPAVAALAQKPVAGLVAGALFAVHPQHVESVAWIAERKDVLNAVAFAALLWLWAAAHHDARSPAASTRLRALALAVFAVGLLAKAMLLTVPALLLVIDVLLLRRLDAARAHRATWARLVVEKLPFAALAIAVAAVNRHAQRAADAGTELWPLDARVANAFVSVVRYLAKTAWPVELSPYYALPAGGWSALATAGSVALVVVVTALAALGAPRAPERGGRALLAGWLWFCGMLVPVIGLVKIGLQAMADRYTYLPHVGLFLVAGVALAHALDRGSRTTRIAVAGGGALVIVALVARTHEQIGVWQSARSLWEHAVRVEPDNPWARHFAADAALVDGDVDAAVAHARAAVRRAPDRADVVERYARALLMAGDVAGAEAPLRAIVASHPTRDPALLLLGEVCRQTAREDEARLWFTRAAEAARANAHDDIEARARAAARGEALTDVSEPARRGPT